jgi:NitT/TauT family transport system substrate-binding protein
MMMRFVRGLSAALFLAASVGTAAADPLTIRHVDFGLSNILSPVMFQNRDIMQHYGKSYTVESEHFAGTSPEITALASNQLDIGTLGFSSFALAVQNAHLDDLRIVADGFEDGVGNHYTSPYIVRADSPIKTIEDLKGKVLVTNAIGGSLDIAMRAMLRKHGLEDKHDYSVVEAPLPTMGAMLKDGRADLVDGSPQFTADPAFWEGKRTLFTMHDAVGPTQMIVFVARKSFLDQNRAAVEDFFEDEIRGTHWFLDPANHDKAVQIVATALKQNPAVMNYLYTDKDYYHDPNGIPNVAAMQHDMETQLGLGFLKQSLDVQKYLALDLIKDAAQRVH